MMTNDDADEAFQALHDTQRVALMLYMDLRDAGNTTGATDAKARASQLQVQIDQLINKELADWQAGAQATIPLLSKSADAAQKAVDRVTKDVQNAQKIDAAMGALDDAISIAMKVLA